MASHDWAIVCSNCGGFIYIGPEPVLCPRCQSPDIDAHGPYDESTKDMTDAHLNDVRFGGTLDETEE